ncbi:MAG: flagellar biosynthesis protein FlhF [Deltaproteobacteria bacterium]|jgi:flagellar biosynthesis protein FlhF|nr:flagellar biosynthesis protein FlhF [Deltaproteobacteria bacterium]
MQVKTFTGASNKEVMDKIKAELGLEAVILESRTGVAGGKKVVTMTAALEREEAAPEDPFACAWNTRPGARLVTDFDANDPDENTGDEQEQRKRILAAASAAQSALDSRYAPKHFFDEWNGIKKYLFALMKPAINLDKLSPSQRTAVEYLQREGANDQALLELYRRLSKNPKESALASLSAMLPVKPWSLENWPQRLHLIAGPFGAGKTTAAVRMAIALSQNRPGRQSGDKVCIVNADADRGNGRLLLKHYAGLSDFAYREAGNAMEMRGVLSEITRRGFARIIVDLPGLPNGVHLRDITGQLGLQGNNSAIKTALHLVLPPHYDDSLTLALLDRYHMDLPGSLVWSKLDEFDRYGALVNIALASGRPVSCLSFGPGLSNTLIPATQVMLWRLIFKHELPVNCSPLAHAGAHPEGYTNAACGGTPAADSAAGADAYRETSGSARTYSDSTGEYI